MINVRLCENAKEDLKQIFRRSRKSGVDLTKVIQEMAGSRYLNDRLLNHDEKWVEIDGINIGKLFKWYNPPKKMNIWRLRPLAPLMPSIVNFRIIYGFYPYEPGRSPEIVILAVKHKEEYKYENDSIISARIERDYLALI